MKQVSQPSYFQITVSQLLQAPSTHTCKFHLLQVTEQWFVLIGAPSLPTSKATISNFTPE